MDAGKGNNLILINGHNPSAILDLKNVPFSCLFTNLLLFTRFSLDALFILVKSPSFLKYP